MRILTGLALLIIIFTVSVAPGYGQESKTKQGSKAAVETPPPPPPAAEYNPNSWKEFSDERGMFSIMFPGTPIEADNGSGQLTGRKFTLKTSAFYLIGYHEYPATLALDLEKEASLRKQVFDATRDTTVSQSKLKVITETDVAIDGHPGRLMKLGGSDGMIIRQKLFVVGKRVYQILVVTPKEALAPDGGRFDETRAAKFLDSFRLAGPKKNEEGKP